MGQLRHEVPGAGQAQSLFRVVDTERGVTQGDIVQNAVVQQYRILRHITNHAAPEFDVDVLQGCSIQQNPALLGLQQAYGQVDYRGLAGAGGADQGGQRAGVKMQGQAVEYRVPIVVEVHILEADGFFKARRGAAAQMLLCIVRAIDSVHQ